MNFGPRLWGMFFQTHHWHISAEQLHITHIFYTIHVDILQKVQVPTLLIVGSNDEDVLRLNEQSYSLLTCEKKLDIVEGASHLFEEPGRMNEMIELSTSWFNKYLKGVAVEQ